MNKGDFSHPRRRPPWWPEGEPWPPHGPPGPHVWGRMRAFFFWRVVGLAALLFVATAGGCTLAFWLAVTDIGPGPWPHVALPFLRFGGVAVGVLALVLMARALRRVAAPVGDLIDAAGRVEAGDYSVRVRERGPREVRALARAFNGMTARLEANETQRRNLLADVTHELRTPVTVIQGNLEGLLDGVYPRDDAHLAPVLEETRVMSRLIDDLRTLALAESGALKLHREPTDLGILVSETAASFRARADAAGVEVAPDLPADLPLAEVDPTRIREVLSNLIANALRYTPRGGHVRVSGRTDEDGRGVVLSVADTGAGIPPEALPHVFDRFYKSSDSGGTGLGLAIAKNLVEAHGGTITAESAGVPGQGTTLAVRLPKNEFGDTP